MHVKPRSPPGRCSWRSRSPRRRCAPCTAPCAGTWCGRRNGRWCSAPTACLRCSGCRPPCPSPRSRWDSPSIGRSGGREGDELTHAFSREVIFIYIFIICSHWRERLRKKRSENRKLKPWKDTNTSHAGYGQYYLKYPKRNNEIDGKWRSTDVNRASSVIMQLLPPHLHWNRSAARPPRVIMITKYFDLLRNPGTKTLWWCLTKTDRVPLMLHVENGFYIC